MSELADHLSGPNAQFLRKTFLVSKVFELMDPYLVFAGMFPAVPVDARSVITTKDNYSDSTDPLKVWPSRLTESADWPNVSISPMTQDSAMLQKHGLQLKIGEDLLKTTADRTVIMKDIQRVAFWMAQFFNANIGTTLVADATVPTWTPTSVWSDTANATPIQDLVTFKRSMRRTDKPFACTDMFVNTADYNDLELFLIDVNADLAKRQMIGSTTVGEDSVYIPALRGTIHRIDEGVDEGTIIGIDKVNPCGTYYYYNDSRYGTQSISYPTRAPDTGTRVMKTVPGFGLNTHQYFDDKSHEVVTQFWFDGIFVVEEPYGVISDTGI